MKKQTPQQKPIALVGLMGAGKSAVAQALGERLGASVADLDSMIEAVEGCGIADLFERSGETWFRQRESDLLAQALASNVRVIACGGGVVLGEDRRALLRERCVTVWLEVSPAEAARRVAGEGRKTAAERPMLAGADALERLEQLLAERAPFYAEVAAIRVPTDGLTPVDIAQAIVTELATLS